MRFLFKIRLEIIEILDGRQQLLFWQSWTPIFLFCEKENRRTFQFLVMTPFISPVYLKIRVNHLVVAGEGVELGTPKYPPFREVPFLLACQICHTTYTLINILTT